MLPSTSAPLRLSCSMPDSSVRTVRFSCVHIQLICSFRSNVSFLLNGPNHQIYTYTFTVKFMQRLFIRHYTLVSTIDATPMRWWIRPWKRVSESKIDKIVSVLNKDAFSSDPGILNVPTSSIKMENFNQRKKYTSQHKTTKNQKKIRRSVVRCVLCTILPPSSFSVVAFDVRLPHHPIYLSGSCRALAHNHRCTEPHRSPAIYPPKRGSGHCRLPCRPGFSPSDRRWLGMKGTERAPRHVDNGESYCVCVCVKRAWHFVCLYKD